MPCQVMYSECMTTENSEFYSVDFNVAILPTGPTPTLFDSGAVIIACYMVKALYMHYKLLSIYDTWKINGSDTKRKQSFYK